MAVLNREIQLVQNPSLGAILLWRFAVGYGEGSQVNNPTPVPLLFTILPIIYHEDTFKYVISTRKSSGLRAFATKFSKSKNLMNDQILGIHFRSLQMKKLTMRSLRMAAMSKLISIDYKEALAIPLSSTPPRLGIPGTIRELLKGAEKLGYWYSQVSLHEISVILKVSF
jgi:hypothetical protein